MVTKGNDLFMNEERATTDIDSRFTNLNLNQSHKSYDVTPVQSYSKSNFNKDFAKDIAVNNSKQDNSQSWKTSSKDLRLKALNDFNSSNGEEAEIKKSEWMNKCSNTTSSTLSLHITAYENGASNNKEKCSPKKAKERIISSFASTLQEPFEYPRQMEDSNKMDKPEVMHFKASQKLLAPNQTSMEQEQSWLEAYKSIAHHKKPSQEDFQHLVDICNKNGTSVFSEKFPELVPPILIRFFSFFDTCEENTFEPMVMSFAEKCLLENPNCIHPSDLQVFITYFCRRCIKGIRNVVRPALSFLYNVVSKVVIYDNVVPIIVTAMSILSPQELYFSCTFNVMKAIFEHHYGSEAITMLQKLMSNDFPDEILTNISTYTITAMARGAVDLYAMLFYGPSRIKIVEMPLTPMLPYLFKAIESHSQVCKEVLKSVSLIVVKHGGELDALSWEAVLELLFKVSETEDVLEDDDIIKKFDYIISHISKIILHGNFRGSIEHYFDLVDATAKLQNDEALLTLIDYKYDQIVSLHSDRYQPMREFVEKFLNPENKFNDAVRAKARKTLDFLNIYNLLLEMPQNIELKAKLKNFNSTITHVQRYCFGQTPQILKQFVSYYVSHHGRLSLREFEESEPPHADLLFYEVPETTLTTDDSDHMISKFVKTEILDVKNLKETLQLSMGIRGSLKKTRHLFIHEQVRIYLDRVEDLGDFIEIEVRLDEHQEPQDGYQTAEYFMAHFGIPKEDFIKGAYIDRLIESMNNDE